MLQLMRFLKTCEKSFSNNHFSSNINQLVPFLEKYKDINVAIHALSQDLGQFYTGPQLKIFHYIVDKGDDKGDHRTDHDYSVCYVLS